MHKSINISKPIILLSFGLVLMVGYAFILQTAPIADLAKEFGVPSAVGGLVADSISGGATAVTIIGILGGFLTGGLGIVANAGRAALMKYLKDELQERGRRAFIAW
ncbi:uberolysin/carnocyclin family circular bacteriocin [Halobacillus sp. A5]|uniref:uberolysin/carnocyclin family circular bacteriocin n=1 Tax=Halobacillus sp. A5 TaxID=2880263 RepID=UPI0020A6A9CA|nr:uberolysin/carnocyclin family circular bacteriocin [Halobacillus sp. A5]MCP3027035.1 uberolysin/carnocyclin family circular bacteriocin [Halobacillus sp. A5]